LKLDQHACKEGHKVGSDEVRILGVESNSRYRKCKELAHMTCLNNLISQPSLDISPIWIPLISIEVTNSKRSLWHDKISHKFYKFKSCMFNFGSTDIIGSKRITDFIYSPFIFIHGC
jgi:hypothetical protein